VTGRVGGKTYMYIGMYVCMYVCMYARKCMYLFTYSVIFRR